MAEDGAPSKPASRQSLSAAYRIAFTYSGAFALAVLALGTGVYLAADAEFRHEQDLALSAETSELVRDFDLEGMTELRRDIARRQVGNAARLFDYALLDPMGRKLAGDLPAAPIGPGWHGVNINPPGEEPDRGRALATRLRTGETLVVALDSDALEEVDQTILALFAAAFAAVLILGVVGALLLGRYLRGRLERIGDTAAAIAAGQLDRRVPVGTRQDEFDRLGAAINAMLDRITALMENLRQVSTDLAHDLRTPLGRVRANLEAGLEQADPDRLRRAAERALGHSDDLLSLFAAILRISEVERGAGPAARARLDLAELAADLIESYAPAVADGGRSLRLAATGPAWVSADRALLVQALANLIDNAQIHTPAGTVITVSVQAEAGTCLVSVDDTGPGVPEGDRERIIRRFVRLERSRTTRGHGLGLYMVGAIANAHGGRLQIGDNAPGLRVSLILPFSE